ncbi:Mss4-like protein [Paraphoma chrysanthemicola]|nr:Mss4-like protein [Paraphoma chrysanthemicola]
MLPATQTFHATCHCRAGSLSFTIPSSQLPIPAHFCHCSMCRYINGTLMSIHAKITPPQFDESTFTTYRFGETCVKFFCTTCGAHMLDRVRRLKTGNSEGGDHKEREEEEEWFIAVSLVDAAQDIWDFREHIFVESTRDGGLATALTEINGKHVKLWKERPVPKQEQFPRGVWTPKQDEVRTTLHLEEKLQVKCLCGGIEFFISRPNSSTFESVHSSLVPIDKSKYHGSHDACTSCRLTLSNAIVSWVFPPISALSLPDGSAYPSNGLFGTAKAYKSSKGVERTFCGTCGASATYTCADRPEMVDVAAGLLRGEDGDVRVEEWAEWDTEEVNYEEDAIWPGVIGAFREGLKMNG